MLTVKYTKTGAARYIPHLDTLRHIQRILRRAEIETDYSVGYNPHMLVFMSNPIPLGFASECEYFTVYTECKSTEFIERFNSVSIDGLKITGAVEVIKDPKPASLVHAADYLVISDGIDKYIKDFKAMLTPDFELVIAANRSKEPVKKQIIGDKVKSFEAVDGALKMRLCAGQMNLRPDRLVNSLLLKIGGIAELDIIKKKVYTEINSVLTPLDIVLGI